MTKRVKIKSQICYCVHIAGLIGIMHEWVFGIQDYTYVDKETLVHNEYNYMT